MGSHLKHRFGKTKEKNKSSKRRRPNRSEVPNRFEILQKYIGAYKGARYIPLVLFIVFVLQCACLLKLYGPSKNHQDVILAAANETVFNKRMDISCSSSYLEDIEAFSGCIPSRCGRVVADDVVTPLEADILLSLAKRGFAFGESDGGASIFDVHSGALSKGKTFINIYRLISASELFNSEDITTYRLIRKKIQGLIASTFNISESALHLTHPTFFSLLTNKDAATVHDEYWHTHVDKETYKSFHYTSLLYLNDHGKDFTGGRFIFDEKANFSTVVEPKKARLSGFTSGSENPHHVERVLDGSRYAMTISFTCNPENAIPDPGFKQLS